MLTYLLEGIRLWSDWRKTRHSPALQTNYINDPVVLSRTNITIIDPENLKATFQLTDEMIINLAGGLATNDFVVAEFSAVSYPGSIIKTVLSYDFGVDPAGEAIMGQIERTIDLKERAIHNDLMFIQKQGAGIGTNIFINQIMEALNSSFSTIEVVAAGPDMPPPPYYPYRWDGYKTWIKFGYLLSGNDDRKYKEWAILKKLKEDTLNKLYFLKLHYRFWENDGFSWEGIVDLKKSRTSVLLFKLYLLRKNINVPLTQISMREVPALLANKTYLCKK
jgi:hypothetical protein